MRASEFADVARLGMVATAHPAWRSPLRGRIVTLPKHRCGAWIRDAARGVVEYTDCVWIDRLSREHGTENGHD